VASWRVGFRLRGCDAVAFLLIQAGAPVDNVEQRNLILLAVTSTTVIQMLLNQNVAISDLRDEEGHTPLHIAASCNAFLDVLSKLVDCGVDLEARVRTWDCSMWTCSTFAIRANNADALRLFLLAGASVDACLLLDSIRMRSYKCTILLLAAGADVEARDKCGRTICLQAARKTEFQSVVRHRAMEVCVGL
jgi:ankyrin repeat protein